MNTNKIVPFFFLSLLLPLTGTSQNLSLPDAVQSALSTHPKLKQMESRKEQKSDLTKSSWGNYLPSVSVQGTYNRLNGPLEINLSPVREVILQLQSKNSAEIKNLYGIAQGAGSMTDAQKAQVAAGAYQQLDKSIPAFVESVKDQTYPSANITAIQPLFTGGKLLAASGFARSEEVAADAEFRKTREDIILETTKSYCTVLLLQSVVETRKQVLEGMKIHLKQAIKAESEGLISYQQRLRAEVAVSDADQNLSADQNNLALAFTAFKSVAGIPESAVISLTDSLFFRELSDSVQLAGSGFSHQPVLSLLAAKEQSALMGSRVKLSEFMPNVALFGRYELFPDDLSVLEPKWIVGVSLSMNLFRGGSSYYDWQAAKSQVDEVKFARKEAERQISLWMSKSWQTQKSAARRYQNLAVNVKLAQENLRVAETRFKAGMATSLDVIDARLVLEKNQIDRHQALFTYQTSVADCYAAAGLSDQILTWWVK